MHISRRAMIGMTTGASLLALTSQSGFAADLDQAAEQLSLPVGRTAQYFNKATDTAVIERCQRLPDAISCSVRVLSNETLLQSTERHTYSSGPNGQLQIQVAPQGSRPWTPDTYNDFFKPASRQAAVTEWTAGQPLARTAQDGSGRVVQNDVGEVRLHDPDSVSIRSSIPAGPNRGFEITNSFNREAGSVQLTTGLRAFLNGAAAEISGAQVSRSYDHNSSSLDGDILAGYARRAASGTAYTP